MTGVDGSQEDGVEVEADDSRDGGVLVNGNDGEEHWGMNK
jgi:coatomer subunit beta'